MIERVARALDPYAFSVDVQPAKEGPLTVDDIWAERQFTARRRARDAIEAMREPTGAMLEAGCKVTHVDGWELNTMASDLQSTWPAMIGAALK